MLDEHRLNVDGPAPAPTVVTPRGSSAPPRPPQPPDTAYTIAPSGDGAFESKHLFDYLWIVYKRRWLAATTFVVVVVANALYAYTRVPIYRATARVIIQNQRQTYGLKDTTDNSTDLQMQLAILRSRSLAKKTMQSLGIWHESPAGEGLRPAAEQAATAAANRSQPTKLQAAWTIAQGVLGMIIGRSPAPPPISDEASADARQIDGFLGGFTITQVTGSGIIDIMYTSLNPAIAARYANALARAYVEQNLEFKAAYTQEISKWLAEHMVDQRAKIEASEKALQQYRETHGVVMLDERGTIVAQGLADLTASATKARTDRIEKESLYNQVHAMEGNLAALEAFPRLGSNTAVQQAKTELTNAQRQVVQLSETLLERHPDLIKAKDALKAAERRISTEIMKAAEAIRLDFEKAKATEESLTKTLEDQKREALASEGDNGSGVELNVLMRDVESNRQVYNTMMDKAREADLSGEIKSNNIRVLDDAEVPRSPAYSGGGGNMQYSMLAGLLLGVGLAFFFEYLDDRIKSPEQIKTHLGVAFLGLVPATKVGTNGSTPLLSDGVSPLFAEAFGGVRTNALFSMPEDGSRTILVASAGPREGKTLVASNLAVALAQAGQRVMIVDCDLRRPRVHEVFSVPQEPGLSNLIVGDAKASEMIRTRGGVTVLPAGRIPPNPAELLGSKRFQELIARLGERFEWIVIDSPPVLAVTDATILGHLASGVMFVVASEMTSKHTARTAIEQLVAAHARILGAVLNRVDLDANSYYYSRYYRREYSQYYVSK